MLLVKHYVKYIACHANNVQLQICFWELSDYILCVQFIVYMCALGIIAPTFFSVTAGSISAEF